MKRTTTLVFVGMLVAGLAGAFGLVAQRKQSTPQLGDSSARSNPDRVRERIREQVRHELAMLPDYSVFDWIEAEVVPKDIVVLRGQVTRPTTKTDAGNRLRKLESVSKVTNQIEVLPLSTSDDAIRIAMYRSIFRYNSPLFRYSTLARPTIHIIVNNGRVALKGFVADAMDRQIAYTSARDVPGVFEVRNELKVLKER